MKKVAVTIGVFVVLTMIFLSFIFVNHYDREGIRCYLPYTSDKTGFFHGFFGDSIQYKEYRYDSNDSNKILKNNFLNLVSYEDVEIIKGFFDNFEKWQESVDFEGYNFDKSQIQQGDYFFLYIPENRQPEETKYFDYDVWYFDVDKCVLYYIHSNL